MITRIAHAPAPVPAAAPAPAPAPAPTDVDVQGYLHPDVVRTRTEAGRVAEYETGTLPPGTLERGAPSYFRTFEQVKAKLSELAAKYPDLVDVVDIGDTYATSGKPQELLRQYGLTPEAIADQARHVLKD